MHPVEFVQKWRGATLTERAAAQQHFLDLCRVLDVPTPAEVDRHGQTSTFEKGLAKSTGGQGWADVWYRDRAVWAACGCPGKTRSAAPVAALPGCWRSTASGRSRKGTS